MRWNAVAATFAPMLLLFRFRPGILGVKRYAIALAVWIGFTGAAYATNEALTMQREYYWYWSHAYEDIAGTLEYVPTVDDKTLLGWLDGVPLTRHTNLHASFRAIYDPAQYFQLVRPGEPDTIFLKPSTEAERTAVARAWKRIVTGNIGAYLMYRYDNFRRVLRRSRASMSGSRSSQRPRRSIRSRTMHLRAGSRRS
jgi:hypothetical protein